MRRGREPPAGEGREVLADAVQLADGRAVGRHRVQGFGIGDQEILQSRVIHALGIDADQHRIHAAAVVRHLLDVTLEIFHGDRHRSLTASLGVHAFTTVEIVEHAARAVLLGGIPRRIRPGNLCE